MALSNLTSNSLSKARNGLLGMGNWATVTATTGSPTTGTYTDSNGVEWKYYRWTSSGSVTVTAGVVDCLLVSGGGAISNGGPADDHGGGGSVVYGVQSLPTGTLTVTVGAAGSASSDTNNTVGSFSVLGPIQTGMSYMQNFGPGATTTGTGSTTNTGFTSSITGTSLVYAEAGSGNGSTSGRGDGGTYNTDANKSAGVVIIRVPTAFAQA